MEKNEYTQMSITTIQSSQFLDSNVQSRQQPCVIIVGLLTSCVIIVVLLTSCDTHGQSLIES